jgi:prolyl-tRNA editing enzyme YbaK/EbsC (Cys-tRNA(Pro) deacylase)
VLIDDTLAAFREIWAAAGTPHSVVKLTFNDLIELTKGKVAAISSAAG